MRRAPRRRRPDVALSDHFRQITRLRSCHACGVAHERGAFMHYSVALVGEVFCFGYFCAEGCESGAYQWPDRPLSRPTTRFDVQLSIDPPDGGVRVTHVVHMQDEQLELYVGDALEVLGGLPKGYVQAVIADPPYSSGGMLRADRVRSTVEKYVNSEYQKKRVEFDGDSRDGVGFSLWSVLWLVKAREISTSGAPVCVFTDWRQLPATIGAVQAAGWVWRGVAVWDKTGASRNQAGRFSQRCEFIVWGSNGPMAGDRDAPTLQGHVSCPVGRDKIHIAQKPLGVMQHLVQICERGGRVLDPFAGSGTTGLAALMDGHPFVGIESRQATAEAAWERMHPWRLATGTPSQAQLFEGGASA